MSVTTLFEYGFHSNRTVCAWDRYVDLKIQHNRLDFKKYSRNILIKYCCAVREIYLTCFMRPFDLFPQFSQWRIGLCTPTVNMKLPADQLNNSHYLNDIDAFLKLIS